MELNSSELGTKEYWERSYNAELNNFNDHGDIGEIWFGEESIFRIIKWLESNYVQSKEEPVIDIGCGNGMMLVEMAREGFKNLVGIDYSEQAIKLASAVIVEQNMESKISLEVCDLISSSYGSNSFAMALDKGTYDAVSLNPEAPEEKRLIYTRRVHELLRPRGLFILTSCNWTDEELVKHYEKYFKLVAVIPTPHFTFGGKLGKLNLDVGRVRAALHRALAVWSKNSKLSFSEVNSDNADILVFFERGYHNDGFPFDGRGQVLAHAFFPCSGRGGDAHFDEDEIWSVDQQKEGEDTNLFAVAAHEFGHSLGLSHSSVIGSLMFPWYQTFKGNFQLPEDDREAIQRLYVVAYYTRSGGVVPSRFVNPSLDSSRGRIFLFQKNQIRSLEGQFLVPSRQPIDILDTLGKRAATGRNGARLSIDSKFELEEALCGIVEFEIEILTGGFWINDKLDSAMERQVTDIKRTNCDD